jgi:hypothetical protein
MSRAKVATVKMPPGRCEVFAANVSASSFAIGLPFVAKWNAPAGGGCANLTQQGRKSFVSRSFGVTWLASDA